MRRSWSWSAVATPPLDSREVIGALAYRISDVGASGGIVVTPIGVQRGGHLIANAENIHVVQLDADSATTGYLMRFLGHVIIGPRAATAAVTGNTPIANITLTDLTE